MSNNILAIKRLAAYNNSPVLIDSACRAELLWWKDALQSRNGVSFLEHDSDSTKFRFQLLRPLMSESPWKTFWFPFLREQGD